MQPAISGNLAQILRRPASFTYPLAEADLGIAQTVYTMQRLIDAGSVDPRVRSAALHILREEGVPAGDEEGEITALFHWVQRNFRFTKDPIGKEVVGTVPYLLSTRAGDCDDYVVVLGALLKSLGHAVRIVTIAADLQEPRRQSHVYLQARLRGRWMGVDATQDNAYVGWEPPRRYSMHVWGSMLPRRVCLGAYKGAGLGQTTDETFPPWQRTDQTFPPWQQVVSRAIETAEPALVQAAASRLAYGKIPRAEGQLGLQLPGVTNPNAGLIALGIGAVVLAVVLWKR